MIRLVVAPLVLLLGVACARPAAVAGDPATGLELPSQSAAAVAPAPAAAPAQEAERARVACLSRWEALLREPALPGTPELDAARPALLARAKAEPVVFARPPVHSPAASPEVAHYRGLLASARSPGAALVDLYPTLRRRPEIARQVLLREGYLYTERAGVGVALVDLVELRHLFTAEELILSRGALLLRLRRDGQDYRYVDGPDAGEKAGLFLFDRVWVDGEQLSAPLHRSVADLAVETGADRVAIVRWTERGVLGRLRYGTRWIDAVFDHRESSLELGCEVHPPEVAGEVADARALGLRRHAVLSVQRAVIEASIAEQLPFDEPKTEDGQQDGNLRPQWRWAYDNGWDIYRFNDDTYHVFDSSGRPRVPQVCIDFIIDTFERASGTWWNGRGENRLRVVGRLDFAELDIENRRSVERFVDFAWSHPAWFDAYDLPSEERIRFQDRERFFAFLAERADAFMPGDIVTIHGPRGDEDHYHSFFVVRADPVTGMPILLAANAGRPRLRTWEQEMRNAPRRSIRSRLRPRLEWLEATTNPSQTVTLAAPGAGRSPAG